MKQLLAQEDERWLWNKGKHGGDSVGGGECESGPGGMGVRLVAQDQQQEEEEE